MTRPAAVYLRVSSVGQADDDRFGLEVQAGAIRQYAQRCGLSLADTYTDTIAGTRHRRENLDRLLDEAPRYEAVIISSVDRLGRRNRINYAVLEELLDTGLEVHSADMGIVDPEDEGSMLQFGVRSLFAELDHRRLARRLHAAKVQKVKGGSPVHPLNAYGWRDGRLDEREAHWLRWAYRRALDVGLPTVARELNAQGVLTRQGRQWNPTRLRLMLVNPLYRGEYQMGRASGTILASCEVEAIVDPELWHRVQEAMARRHHVRGRPGSRRDRWPLTGRLTCAECGRAMSAASNQRPAYVCSSRLQPPHMQRGCTHWIRYRADLVHDAIRDALHGLALDGEALTSALRPVPVAPPDLGALRAGVEVRLRRLDQAHDAGAYDLDPAEYARRRQALLREHAALADLPPPAPLDPDPTSARAALGAALDLPLLALVDRLGLRATIDRQGEIRLTLDPQTL